MHFSHRDCCPDRPPPRMPRPSTGEPKTHRTHSTPTPTSRAHCRSLVGRTRARLTFLCSVRSVHVSKRTRTSCASLARIHRICTAHRACMRMCVLCMCVCVIHPHFVINCSESITTKSRAVAATRRSRREEEATVCVCTRHLARMMYEKCFVRNLCINARRRCAHIVRHDVGVSLILFAKRHMMCFF